MSSRKNIAGLINVKGIWHIDKFVRGYGRLCESTKESSRKAAEGVLEHRLLEIRKALDKRKAEGGAPRRTFGEAAMKYVEKNKHIASIDEVIRHLGLVAAFLNHLPVDQVHDGTLEAFIFKRRQEGVKTRTINHTLETVRRVLNAAARSYRDNLADGSSRTWLAASPAISMLEEHDARRPYPLAWDEQDYLVRELPPHLQRMALFNVNTGTREEEVCSLRWQWEVPVPELQTSVFIVPGEFVKNGEDRLIVLNRVAASIIEARREGHPYRVFFYRPNADRAASKGTARRAHTPKTAHPVERLNNNAWRKARRRAAINLALDRHEAVNEAFARVRVHDLKHTYGRRLRAAGVPEETRKALLGHKSGEITTHYSAPEIAELIDAANQVCAVNRQTPTLTLLKRRAG